MPTFTTLNDSQFVFQIAYKVKPTKGFLVYDYNPILCMRTSSARYRQDPSTRIYLDKRFKPIEIDGEFLSPINIDKYKDSNGDFRSEIAPAKAGATPEEGHLYIEYYPNELVDFRTTELGLDINHPVDIEIQPSYDGSVNLILNDDLNTPKLINTRFTATEEGQYEVVDRTGDNDTNIYDEDKIIGETNLYKSIDKIPNINFLGVSSGGQLKVGNYVFYFKYVDSDGNETDFVGESGIVSIFKGSLPRGAKGNLGDSLSNKLVRFALGNVDNSYDYVNVYCTRSTGSYNKSELTYAYKIGTKFPISASTSTVVITGLEEFTEISLNEINISYNVISKAKAQAQVQSRLFLGNVAKTTIPYTELADLSLRILPYTEVSSNYSIGYLNHNYSDESSSPNKNEYYNPDNIYYRLGYWNDLYRLGVVYILNNFTLSPVFNIRGGVLDPGQDKTFTHFPLYEGEGDNRTRKIIELDSDKFIQIANKEDISKGTILQENGGGVIKIVEGPNLQNQSEGIFPVGIKLRFDGGSELINELKKYTKGFFIVRQKRVPTTYCQGITIGIDNNSHIPVIPISESGNELSYLTESYLNSDRELDHEFESRMLTTKMATINASIIPEAELNSELYSQLFSASQFNIESSKISPSSKYFTQSDNSRHYYISSYNTNSALMSRKDVTLTYVADGIQLISSGITEFSSKAGVAEEAYRYSQLEKENNTAQATNLLRGEWSSYVGIDGYTIPTSIFDVKIPGYEENLMEDYFKVRMSSSEPYFPICDRTDYDSLIANKDGIEVVCFRGDCFIGNFTHRMCRNFQDPEAPNNDKIINPDTWKEHYKGYANGALDMEEAVEINRGDVNAVKIGHWITFKCMSNINFALRAEDDSNGSELALIGHPRTFVPASWFQADGEYKVPESTVINVGYNSTTSDKYNFILPDVPYIKNDFSNRIMYSDIHVTDAFKNAYRTFQINNYRDYSKEYGAIIDILEWYGNILVVFEHGVGILPVNEKVPLGGEKNQEEVYINSNKVLPERPTMLSKTFGSQWKDSIVKSERFVYGVDTVGKRIWRTDGRSFETISDFKIQTYLNDNIRLTERELTPLLGVRNVKSHYNAFKYDIMFTFYNNIKSKDNLGNDITSIEWNLCFNEKLNLWTTRYSWIPLLSENIDNIYFSYDKESAKNVSSVSSCWKDSYTSRGIVLENCYTVNDSNSIYSTKYLKEVVYPGVEFPILSSTTKEIGIGELSLKLDSIDETSINSLDFSFDDPAEGSKNDNDDFRLDGNKLVFKLTPTTYRKYVIGEPDSDPKVDPQFYATIDILVRINRKGVEEGTLGQIFKDTLTIRLSYLNNIPELQEPHELTYFWKHGVAGIIDNQTEIKNCVWYDRQYPFELEFIVNKEGARHKIFDNFQILSNNVPPVEILYDVIGDAYAFSNCKENSYKYQSDPNFSTSSLGKEEEDGEFVPEYIITFDPKLYYKKGKLQYDDDTGEPLYLDQLNAEFFKDRKLNQYTMRKSMDVRDIKVWGNILGNSVYKEDLFYLEIDPMRAHRRTYENGEDITVEDLPFMEIRPRDKFMRVRFKYDGKNKPIITAIQTIYTPSYN